ncbi:YaaR family protein [Caldicellulosiruptor naganoensis]|uniref:YaaR family protein n=1 Tax=Caldicellulosiruptor naganoensis TaxID=29324 RepID=A0ABY7BHR6_9FIRM|nr:YaaR family protein [Caldicellulosiruptor naganoensis]WAM31275.1 YaaR family protein [Caldicellulosiruptor naganoensis]
MRIEDVKRNNISNVTLFQDSKKVEKKQESFSGYVKQLERQQIINRIKELIEKIDSLGKSLAQKMDLLTLKEYKKSIKELLSYTVFSSHEYFKESLFARKGRHKVFGIVKKIDEKMDLLTQEIIKKETDNIKVLSYIGEIKGLLIDLFM